MVVAGWLLLLSPLSVFAQAGAEFGIDRSNLTRETKAVQEKTLQDIHALHALVPRCACRCASDDSQIR
jgi:hypothetical protein